MTGKGKFLEAQNVAFSYSGSDSQVLHSVSAQIAPGSFLAILGVNGSGKSTFLSCLDDVLRPQAGTVLLDGESLSQIGRMQRAQSIAYVAQHSHANRLNVYDALLLGRKPYVKTAPSDHDYDVVDRVMQSMDLEKYAMRYVDELSGGEYQKMIIARSFVQEPDVLLLDEPTNNLDMANQAEVLRFVRQAVDQQGLAAAAVMHDINLALRYCDRFLFIKQGEVLVCGGPEVIDAQLIKNVYGIDADVLEHKGRKVIIPE